MYLDIEKILHPVATPVVSVCKGILTVYSFLFLVTPRHCVMRKYSCGCHTCSDVRGRSLRNSTVSRGAYLDVPNCARNKIAVWREDHFTVTKASGIKQRKKRVAEMIAKKLAKAKPGVWGFVQTREMWSKDEQEHMCPGHHWPFEFSDGGKDSTVRHSSCCLVAFFLDKRGVEWFTRVHASTMEIELSGSRGGFTVRQILHLRSGIQSRTLMTRRLLCQWSSTRANCVALDSTFRKWSLQRLRLRSAREDARVGRGCTSLRVWDKRDLYSQQMMMTN